MDPFQQAHADALKAVAIFLPSLAGRVEPPPPQPAHPAQRPEMSGLSEGVRVLSLANHVETQSARMARGLPPDPPPPPSPQEQFGNELDPVHIRALSSAVASIPEAHRGNALSELHANMVKWIGSHNGKVVVDGKLHLATDVNQAGSLGMKIINDAVDDHDQRQNERAASLESAASKATEASSTQSPVSPPSAEASAAPARAPSGISASSPQIIPPAPGQTIEPLGAPRPVAPKEDARIGKSKGGRDVLQPRKTIESNRKLALEAAPELQRRLSGIAGGVKGAQFIGLRPQKDEARLNAKAGEAHPSTLSDYLGAQIAVDTPQAKDELVRRLKNAFPVVDVDDAFDKGRPDKAGYASVHLQLKMRNGLTAEVQVIPREVAEANTASHPYYEAGRDAEERGDQLGRDRQWAKASAINQAALKQFRQRNGMESTAEAAPDHASRIRDLMSSGGYEAGEPVSLGGRMFVPVTPPQQ